MAVWFTRLWLRLTGRTAQPQFPHLYWLFSSAWLCQAAYVAARLDIAEKLRQRPLSVEELAEQCNVRTIPLMQVLRALAGFGIFAEKKGKFHLNSKARPLLTDDPHSVHDYALLWGEQLYPAASRLLEQVRSGVPAFETQFGKPIWQHYEEDAQHSNTFDQFMSSATDAHNRFITEALDCSSFHCVIDIGGGRGSLISAVLNSNRHLQGVWFDRPELKDAAQARLASDELSDRCRLETGSFLEGVPSNGDLYLLKHVLHDWPDESAQAILQNIAAVMSENATLVIVEAVLATDNNRDGLCKLRDLEQMLWTGGRVRTESEFRRLLENAGLVISHILPTPIVDVRLILTRRRKS